VFGKPMIRQEWLQDGRTTVELEHDERTASFTELVFDLPFVAAVSKMGAVFRHKMECLASLNPDGCPATYTAGFAVLDLLGLYCPLYLLWSNVMSYLNRFENGDSAHQIFIWLEIVLVSWLAGNVNMCGAKDYSSAHATYGGCADWSYFLFAGNLLLALMYLRVWIYLPRARLFAQSRMLQHALVALCYVVNGILDPDVYNQTAFVITWWLPMILDMAFVQLLNAAWPRLRRGYIPINIMLYTERIGLFFVIALGESIVAAASLDAEALEHNSGSSVWLTYAYSAATITLAYSFKVTYFDVGRVTVHDLNLHALRWSRWAGFAYIWLHLPLLAALLLMASVLEGIIGELELNEPGRWILSASVAGVQFIQTLIQLSHKSEKSRLRRLRRSYRIIARLIVALAIVLLPLVPEDDLPLWGYMLAVTLLVVATTTADVFGSALNEHGRAHAKHDLIETREALMSPTTLPTDAENPPDISYHSSAPSSSDSEYSDLDNFDYSYEPAPSRDIVLPAAEPSDGDDDDKSDQHSIQVHDRRRLDNFGAAAAARRRYGAALIFASSRLAPVDSSSIYSV
jgi:low temperature requirement protein LtrA